MKQKDNVAKSGIDVRGVGLSQTDKTTRCITNRLKLFRPYSYFRRSGTDRRPSCALTVYPRLCHKNDLKPIVLTNELSFVDERTAAFGKWKVRYDAAASKAYQKSGKLSIPSNVK